MNKKKDAAAFRRTAKKTNVENLRSNKRSRGGLRR